MVTKSSELRIVKEEIKKIIRKEKENESEQVSYSKGYPRRAELNSVDSMLALLPHT